MAGVSWDESHFRHFLGENDGKQMDLSPSAWSGTGCLKAACESGLGLPQTPWRLQREVYHLAVCSGQKKAPMLSLWPGQADLNKPLFSSMRICYFEERKKLFQPTWTSIACLLKKMQEEAESRVHLVPVRITWLGKRWSGRHWRSSRIKS